MYERQCFYKLKQATFVMQYYVVVVCEYVKFQPVYIYEVVHTMKVVYELYKARVAAFELLKHKK